MVVPGSKAAEEDQMERQQPAQSPAPPHGTQATLKEPPAFAVANLDRDPHGIFRRCRPLTPVIRRAEGGYIALRADDVERLITDPRTRQMETESVQARGVTQGALFEFFRTSMLFTNGTDHRRRRAPVSRAFAWQLIAALRPRIRAIAEELIEAAGPRREMNFLDDFCSLIPARIVSDVLGLPREDVPRFTGWVYTISRAINASFTRDDIPQIEVATQELRDYVDTLLSTRRKNPGADFLTGYVSAVDEAQNLSAIETATQIMSVILGGSDTTRTALAVQLALLLEHREQWESLCASPVLIPDAVSEALRFEPAVASVPRVTLEDIDLGGYLVPRGQLLTLSTMSAMRDPARYADPDRFDITRIERPTRHLVFGGGSHRCLGELLARAELEESLAVLARHLPNVELAGRPPELTGHTGIRRINGMRITW
jgi:cytochrome P450 family 103